MQTFPKPLSVGEEQEYLQRYHGEGDREARNILIERNLRLVAYVAKKYQSAERENEDLLSIGTLGLIKAVDTFRPDKKIRLATYASKCIDNEILMHLRNTKKQAKDTYLYEPIGSDKEGNEISLIDIIEYADEDVVERINLEENIKKLYRYVDEVLDDREKEIILLRYGLFEQREKTQKEIAGMYGISRSYVSRIEKKALEKLKKCYDREV